MWQDQAWDASYCMCAAGPTAQSQQQRPHCCKDTALGQVSCCSLNTAGQQPSARYASKTAGLHAAAANCAPLNSISLLSRTSCLAGRLTADKKCSCSCPNFSPSISESLVLNHDPAAQTQYQAQDSSSVNYALQVLPVALIFFMAQFLFTLSLANTSVTSNTILSSSASMWTLLTSALVLGETVTACKLLSVGAVVAGEWDSSRQ